MKLWKSTILTALYCLLIGGCTTAKKPEIFKRQTSSAPALRLDHIILGGPDLIQLNINFAARAGVEPRLGGQHKQLGTHNALVSIGSTSYLELIAPDPTLHIKGGVQVLGIGRLAAPTVVGWALATDDIEAWQKILRGKGFKVSQVLKGQRLAPDGQLFKYKTLFFDDPNPENAMALVPFIIQWEGAHPTHALPPGCELAHWSAQGRGADKYGNLFAALEMEFIIRENPEAKFFFELQCAKNREVIRF